MEAGAKFGRYTIVDRLGAGGMGDVYRAYDADLQRIVALKTIRKRSTQDESDSLRDRQDQDRIRWVREAQSMARVSHPNIVPIFDIGESDAGPYMAMEFVDGWTLKGWLSKEKRNWRTVCRVLLAAGAGLAAAHRAGLIHRDFKPDNILIAKDGSVKVADFGLARPADGGPVNPDERTGASVSIYSSEVSVEGQVVGTPAYMAPEQMIGAPADERADQYAFCVTLYESIFHARPFERETIGEAIEAIALRQYRATHRHSLAPRALFRLLDRGLSFAREQRFSSLQLLLDEIDALLHRTHARLRVGAAALLIVSGVAVPFVRGSEGVPADPRCDVNDLRSNDDWSVDDRQAIRATYLRSGAAEAFDALSRIESALDDYSQKIASVRGDVCQKRMESSTWSAAAQSAFSMTMQCLDVAAASSRTILASLGDASQETIFRASGAISSLADPNACGQATALSRFGHVVADYESEADFARAQALANLGKYDAATQSLQTIIRRASDSSNLALAGRAYLSLGLVQIEERSFALSKRSFQQAFHFALAAGDDETELRSYAELALSGVDELANIDARASSILRRNPDSPDIQVYWLRVRGDLNRPHKVPFWRYPERTRAIYQDALERITAREGPSSVNRVPLLTRLAEISQINFQDSGSAQRYLEEATRIQAARSGRIHPVIIDLLRLSAEVLMYSGQFREAAVVSKDAYDRAVALHGSQSLANATVMGTLATAYFAAGNFQLASELVDTMARMYALRFGENNFQAWFFYGYKKTPLAVHRGSIAQAQRVLKKWIASYIRSAQVAVELSNDLYSPAAHSALALGDPELAADILKRFESDFTAKQREEAGISTARIFVEGELLVANGEVFRGRELIDRALEFEIRNRQRELEFEEHHLLLAAASARRLDGDLAGARAALDRAREAFVARVGEDSHLLLAIEEEAGRLEAAAGDANAARNSFLRALERFDPQECGPEHRGRVLLELAKLSIEQGVEEAKSYEYLARAIADFAASEHLQASSWMNEAKSLALRLRK
jgi:serine/threonine protein kinase